MCHPAPIRQGANGYVLSMGTQIWDPEQGPEQTPEQSAERTPEHGPEQTPEEGPEQTPEQTPEQDPEQGPEWKNRHSELGSHSSIFGKFWTPKWPGNGNPSDEKS